MAAAIQLTHQLSGRRPLPAAIPGSAASCDVFREELDSYRPAFIMAGLTGGPQRGEASARLDGVLMPIAREGLREIILATLVLGGLGMLAGWFYWPLSMPCVLVWIWVLSFFRDPPRERSYAPSELCSPADGTVTEISRVAYEERLGGPAIRIGIFLSLFNVHVNRFPCQGTVHRVQYREGEFLDARDPESGERNESNTIWIEPDPPIRGPIVVRQVAGLVARRIISYAIEGASFGTGERFGLIKFGSRTELLLPDDPGAEVLVILGQPVRAGLTILARQSPLGGAEALAATAQASPAKPE